MGLRQVLRRIGQSESGQRRIEHLESTIEDELAFDAHPQFAGTGRLLHRHIDPLFEAPDPARVRGASVTFEPDARTAWHTAMTQMAIQEALNGKAVDWLEKVGD